ncbi:MAG: DEAD/DEAH box helicase [Hyphomicrobiales bacterium]
MQAPGQSIEVLISKMDIDDLQEIVGDDIVTTVSALNPKNGLLSAIREIAKESFHRHPLELFGNSLLRRKCYSFMTKEKLAELAQRVNLNDSRQLPEFIPQNDTSVWQQYLGFFGVDSRGVGPVIQGYDTETVRTSFGLFPHQLRAANRICDILGKGYGRVVLHMPTGAGKTRTAMHIVCRFLNMSDSTVLFWLAASSELLEQAAEAFQEAWSTLGNRPTTLTRFWGSHTPDISNIDDGLVVAGLQKTCAYETREPLDLLRIAARVKLVVVDEAHQAIAPTYGSLINKLAETGMHNALLGLTATPGRTWSDIDSDKQLATFFEDRKVTLEIDGWDDPVSYLINEGYLAKPTFHQIEYEPGMGLRGKFLDIEFNEEEYDEEIFSALVQSTERNVSIVEELLRLVKKGHRRIIFFAASVRHAEVISAALLAFGIDARIVTGTTESKVRRRIISDFRKDIDTPIILCNFGVLTTGFDSPNTSAAVIARPTRSLVLYSQMVGRAIRGPKAGGNRNCEISTVVDIDLSGFGDVTQAFTNWEDVWNEHA